MAKRVYEELWTGTDAHGITYELRRWADRDGTWELTLDCDQTGEALSLSLDLTSATKLHDALRKSLGWRD